MTWIVFRFGIILVRIHTINTISFIPTQCYSIFCAIKLHFSRTKQLLVYYYIAHAYEYMTDECFKNAHHISLILLVLISVNRKCSYKRNDAFRTSSTNRSRLHKYRVFHLLVKYLKIKYVNLCQLNIFQV
jgi:acyl-ACP thioesterase